MSITFKDRTSSHEDAAMSRDFRFANDDEYVSRRLACGKSGKIFGYAGENFIFRDARCGCRRGFWRNVRPIDGSESLLIGFNTSEIFDFADDV